jgi:hypothetical protein
MGNRIGYPFRRTVVVEPIEKSEEKEPVPVEAVPVSEINIEEPSPVLQDIHEVPEKVSIEPPVSDESPATNEPSSVTNEASSATNEPSEEEKKEEQALTSKPKWYKKRHHRHHKK